MNLQVRNADLASLLDVATRTATEAAALLRDGLGRADLVVTTKSTGTDMVTELDRASEQLIADRLFAQRPDDGLLGEEGTDITGTSGVRWIIDPLDGTTNFLYGHPGCNVSVAAEVDGQPAVGVVVDVLTGETFAAAHGAGATRDGVALPLRTSPPELAEALVATGFGYEPERRVAQAELLGHVIGQIRDIRRMGAAAVDLCSVACGHVDAYYERGLAPWDHAAGGLIATETGVIVTDLDFGPPGAHFLVAAPQGLHGALIEVLRRGGADTLPVRQIGAMSPPTPSEVARSWM